MFSATSSITAPSASAWMISSRRVSPTWEATSANCSRTVRPGKMLVRWKDRDMPWRRRQATLRWVMSCSFRKTRPRVGGRRPVMASISVDLPAPLGPMMPCSTPRWATARLTPSSARTLP